MRIIGGFAGGRRLRAPAGATTRPTSDRVREALFSILGAPVEGARALDLFAGSGGLGLEAISRGVSTVVFVDRDTKALQVLRQNIEDLGMRSACEVRRGDAPKVLRRITREGLCYDWIFIDPPYASALATDCLAIIGAHHLLAHHGTLVVEHDKRSEPDAEYGCLVKSDSRRYGDTNVSFYERRST